jgi:predicted Zn-dependent protease
MSLTSGCHSRTALAMGILVIALFLPGCAKRFGGPWPFGEDETAALKKYGPTPVQRIEEMQTRAKKMSKARPQEQETFCAEMAKQIPRETDCNVRLAIISMMGTMNTPSANAVLYAGMKDPEADVRIACCDAWAKHPGGPSTRLLAETLSGDTDMDVRQAAAKALAMSRDKEAVIALGTALEDSNPAMQYVAVNSLKNVTGKDLGNDVNAWRQLARQPDPPLREKTLADRVRQVF